MKTPTLRDLESDRLDACEEGYAFAVERDGDFARIWDECPKGSWMLWMIEKFEVEFDFKAYNAQLKPIDEAYYAQRKPLFDAYELQLAEIIRSIVPCPFEN